VSQTASVPGPLYAAAPAVSFHHGQIWAGTPPEYIDYLDAHFDFRGDDVWLLSFPRSGTAWSHEVISAVLHDGDIAALTAAQRDGRISKFQPIEIGIGPVANLAERIAKWKSMPSPRIVPTHVPCRLFPKAALALKCKRIYALRDPRDVAVSLFHLHRSHMVLGVFKGTWDEFFEEFVAGRVPYGGWFDHTLGWWPHAVAHPNDVLVLTYERLKNDMSGSLHRLGTFLGRRLSLAAVFAIARHTSFENMKVNPFTNRAGSPVMDFSVAPFLRKGIVGDWCNQFTPEQAARVQMLWNEKTRGMSIGNVLAL
jgi:hypothetical protein